MSNNTPLLHRQYAFNFSYDPPIIARQPAFNNDYNNDYNNNINLTISSARPPIFWKDKEIVKQQILNWRPENIKKLIYKINEIELLIKKNMQNSINLINDFILEQLNSKTNN